MKRAVREWVSKAESDYRVAARELRVRKDPSPDAICFHAQQCIEKYLKALLTLHGIVPPRTHDLLHLWKMAVSLPVGLPKRLPGLRKVTVGAVEYRYPGRRPTMATARACAATMSAARDIARRLLGAR